MRILVTALAATALVFGGGQVALADPQSNAVGNSTPRTDADRQFLRDSHYDGESRAVQDAAIELALAQCDYLETVGDTVNDHIYLAESAAVTVEFPYLFLKAAVEAYCPQHRL